MSFDFTAVLTGLCAFVPDEELGNPDRPPTRMRVVMVNATDPLRRSIVPMPLPPDVGLRRHQPVVAFRASQVEGTFGSGLPDPSRLLWFLDRQELRFEVETSGRLKQLDRLEVVQDRPSLSGLERDREDFLQAASLEAIAPEFGDVDPRCFDDSDNEDLIIARLDIDLGRLRAYDIRRTLRWHFRPSRDSGEREPTSLGGSGAANHLASKMALELPDLERIHIVARHLDTGEEQRLILRSRESEPVNVTIGNLCGDCLPPADEHEVILADDAELPEDQFSQVRQDEDFAWFYQLCARREELQRRLDEIGSVVPIPQRDSGHSGNSPVRCVVTIANPFPPR